MATTVEKICNLLEAGEHSGGVGSEVLMLQHDDGRWAAALWLRGEQSFLVHLWSTESESAAREIARSLRLAAECKIETSDRLTAIVGSRPSERIDGSNVQAWGQFGWRLAAIA